MSRAGKATATYADGSTFEGTFDEEKLKQGAGKYTWMGPGGEDGEETVVTAVYEGEYKDGLKHGRGKMTFPGGDKFDGFFANNSMEGEGTYTYTSGDIYSGSFVGGKKEGEGRYEFGKDESQVVGTWVGGAITTGTWELKGAAVYTGAFKNGKPDGEGVIKFTSGIEQSGAYVAKKEGEEDDEGAPVTITWEGVPAYASN